MKKLVTTVAVITGILAPGMLMTGVAFADPAPCPPGWLGVEIGCVKSVPGNGGGNFGNGFNVKPYNGPGG
ncbi:MAG TPA: hypothetical protein VFA63_15915 [Pseudonocardiaceae bacterium]|nr:hypothetical protein [Pseudonocardiaceae bacterium]